MSTPLHPSPAAFLASLLLAALPASADEWVLVFSVEERKVRESPNGDAPPVAETRHYTQTVALGPDYLALEDDRRKFAYDFRGRRMHVVESARSQRQEFSLYYLPSFFEHEIRNRAALGHGLRLAKIGQAAAMFDRFDSEMSLRVVMPTRLPSDPPPPVIETIDDSGALEFRHAGKTAVRFVPDAAPLAAAWQPRFVNFLAYAYPIHPEIRRRLAQTGAIPQELVVRWRAMNTTTTTALRLESSALSQGNHAAAITAIPPAPPAEDPLDAALARVTAVLGRADRPPPTDTIKFANGAVQAGRPLDALLALIEWNLQTGEQLAEEMRRHADAFQGDPACQAYLSAFKGSDKDAAEKSLAINAKIDRRGLARAHMLELQRANLLDQAGRPREARDAFLAVVRANPYHTGALHDLGALLLRHYEHAQAWRCWDAARRLYPGHFMMRDVIRIEMDLVRNQPDFF